MPKRFNTEMPFALYDRAMLDAHSLSAVADLLVYFNMDVLSLLIVLLRCWYASAVVFLFHTVLR